MRCFCPQCWGKDVAVIMATLEIFNAIFLSLFSKFYSLSATCKPFLAHYYQSPSALEEAQSKDNSFN